MSAPTGSQAKGVLRKKIPQLREALAGRFREHHALTIRLVLDHTAHLEPAIADPDAQVDRGMAPFAEARDHLDSFTGVDKRAAELTIAEIGTDMSAFPTAAHLASWTGMASENNITGGKRRSGKTTKGKVWLADMLTQCALFARLILLTAQLAARSWCVLHLPPGEQPIRRLLELVCVGKVEPLVVAAPTRPAAQVACSEFEARLGALESAKPLVGGQSPACGDRERLVLRRRFDMGGYPRVLPGQGTAGQLVIAATDH